MGASGGLTDRAAVGALSRTFPVELVDRVIDRYWRRDQRVRALPARLVFYFTLALCLFPQSRIDQKGTGGGQSLNGRLVTLKIRPK